ncbi:Salt-tolerance protein, putative [Ricinus communis]|uniref:Salt-tolerance protein, putative n=2 Tax=Ricinus communis TaxID=3988 RepID=B9R832_RICCO|nr:Salt-tolerance protein, putative [Ricinus communis]|eukprot:XP_002510475.1 B-box zinc finger protein 21 [Ricinus communis]
MKIQCDVCSKEEASVFCTADEAALCDACDHSVHHANKLASKHHRFCLLHPSSKSFPICDVCQEKRAFVFCQQDRAILCRDCDVPIHKANEHTQKHNRFLLTGVKLSATSVIYMPSSSSSVPSGCDLVPDSKSQQQQSAKKPSNSNPPSSTFKTLSPNSTLSKTSPSSNTVVNKSGDNSVINNEGIGSVSSISEYLMETLPGWHVDDFLDFPSIPFGFCKPDDEILPVGGGDLGDVTNPFSSEMGIWVPQAPIPPHPSQHYQQMVSQVGFKETKEATNTKPNNRRWSDDAFTVPQVSPPSIGSKRSRSFW